MTRNNGTMTEAAFWSRIRSHLRRAFAFDWQPAKIALEKARRASQSTNKRLKHEYQCAQCNEWFARKNVEIHHQIPCGSLNSSADLATFVTNLYCEDEKLYACLCKKCHQKYK